VSAAPNPPGNNGTIKVDDVPFDDDPNNEPHVDCQFQVDFYGYDEGDLNATVTFEAHPPTLREGDDQVLLCRRVHQLSPAELLEESQRHLAIAPTTLARAAKAARAEQGTVVVCHSHPVPGPVHSSPLDLDTESELCGRALWGRLAPRPVAALVLGPDGLDGRLWQDGRSRPLDRVRVVGDQIRMLPPPLGGQVGDEVARQVLAWGEGGQRGLAAARVAVVGVGGTGSQVAVQLAHLGVGELVLVDPDRVEVTNLSRLVGATRNIHTSKAAWLTSRAPMGMPAAASADQ
jgi:hypothetical protein